jgi:hypothetical protein
MIYFLVNLADENRQSLLNETVESKDIVKIEKQEVVYQNDFHTWTNQLVKLKDGRVVTIRVIERNQKYLNK